MRSISTYYSLAVRVLVNISYAASTHNNSRLHLQADAVGGRVFQALVQLSTAVAVAVAARPDSPSRSLHVRIAVSRPAPVVQCMCTLDRVKSRTATGSASKDLHLFCSRLHCWQQPAAAGFGRRRWHPPVRLHKRLAIVTSGRLATAASSGRQCFAPTRNSSYYDYAHMKSLSLRAPISLLLSGRLPAVRVREWRYSIFIGATARARWPTPSSIVLCR